MSLLESQIKYYTIRQKEAKENFEEFQKNRNINKDGKFAKLRIAQKRTYNELLRDYKSTTFFLMNYHNEKMKRNKIKIPEFEELFKENTGIDPKLLK